MGAQFTVILLAELLILFLFSRAVTGSLAGMIHLFTRSRKLSISLLVILFLPGTIIHELAHLLSAGMMMVPVGEIEILPKIENDSVHLGSVEVAQTDIFRRAIIGLAPLFFGTGVILSLFWIAFGLFSLPLLSWWSAVLMYLVFAISNTMFSSRKDMEGIAVFLSLLFFLILAVAGAFYISGFSPAFLLEMLNASKTVSFFYKADLFLAIPIMVDLGLWGIAKIILGLKSA